MKMVDIHFTKPKDVEELIHIWSLMDKIIKATKRGDPLKFWCKFGTPMGAPYNDVVTGLQIHKKDFKYELNRMYDRMYHIFSIAMGMKIYTRKVK